MRVSSTYKSPSDTGYRGIRNVPVYARLAIPVGILFAVIYFGMNWMTARRTDRYHLYFDWELAIPFVPAMIYGYASLLILLLLPAVTLSQPPISVSNGLRTYLTTILYSRRSMPWRCHTIWCRHYTLPVRSC